MVGLTGLVVLPTSGCASRSGWHSAGWEAAMMGAMIVGGLVLGRNMMHGHERATPGLDVACFGPARLLEQRDLLELTDGQVSALESLRDDEESGRRTPEAAAWAAYELLRPVQRAAACPSPGVRQHH